MSLQFGEFNKKVGQEHSRQYAKNGAENYQRIKEEFQRADYSIETLPRFDPAQRMPALILGSGPSLDLTLPFIKDFHGIVFASPSQLSILDKWEIAPNYVVAVDSADCVGEDQILGHDPYGMILLTHPYISPKTLDAWKGNKRYFELIDSGMSHFRDIYPWIRQGFPVAGSVNNTQVLIAHWMGLAPIILAGVDYGFPGGRIRAQDYRKRGPYIFDPKPIEYCETKDGKYSVSQETLFYSRVLLGIWKMYNMPIVQIGDQSSYPEIPFIPPSGILEEINVGPPTENQIKEVDATLKESGMMAIVDSNGVGHFSWLEQDFENLEVAKKELEQATKNAHLWDKT